MKLMQVENVTSPLAHLISCFLIHLMGLWFEIGRDCFSWISNGPEMVIEVSGTAK